ncbi:MAG: hypothetical protein JO345_41180 [Streptosporangiaceae bacterium]|nr:hypothetical protein [Streptosporangiaceae bacterium]
MARNDRVRWWLTPEVVVVLLFVLAAGNPWVADKIINASINTTSSLLGYLYYLLRFPAWRLSTGRSMPNLHYVIGSDLLVFFLIVVTAILSRRLANSPTAGLARFLGAIGAVVLAATIAAVVGGFVTASGLGSSTRTSDGGTGGFVRGAVSQGVFFGALAGLVAAAVIMWRGRAWRTDSAGFLRRVNRGDGVNMPAWSPGGGAKGDVTRYLCMAARTDERFAEQVVDEVLAEETRAVAYSVGVDLNPVLRHCLAASRQRQQRDLALAAVFTVTLVLAPFWTLIGTLCLMFAAQAARVTLARQPAQRQMRYLSPLRGLVVALALLASVVLAFVIRAAIGSVSGPAAWLLGPIWLGVFILAGLAAMYGLIARDKLLTHHTLVSELRRAVFSPEAAPPAVPGQLWIPPRLTAIEEAVGGNVTVYSGYEPFVGFGSAVDGWTFAVPLLPAADPQGLSAVRRDIVPFTTMELIDRARGRLQSALDLGSGSPNGQGTDRLDALILEDRVFVNGSALVTEGLPILPQPGRMPGNRLSPEEIERIALHPRGAVRHYLCAHVPSWGGEIMASTFLHVSTAGDVLYLHCDRRVVGPVTTAYHDVDRMTETMTPGQRLRLLAETVAELPGMAFGSYRRVVHRGLLEWRHDRRLLRDIACAEEDLAFDYGARVSVRQLAIDPHYQNYFQVVDASKHFSIVTRHMLAATRDFLDEHGVDTTEFRAQQMTILNQGIIQSGGISMVGSQAVGAGAQATQTNQAAAQEPAASG